MPDNSTTVSPQKAEDSMLQLIKNNPCGKCRKAMLTICKCKPLSGGGGSSDDDSENEDSDIMTEIENEEFDSEEISELLSSNALVIENENQLGSLRMRLLYNPGLLAGKANLELHRYMNTILRELEEFKREHGITTDCLKIERDSAGNILSIRILLPRPELYDAFMQKLASKNLLPAQSFEERQKATYPAGKNHFTPRSPFSMRLTRSENRTLNEKEDEEKKLFSIRPRPPKPKHL
jgi:hypothetical protein